MNNYEMITKSPESFSEWWAGNIRCCGCPLELPCEDPHKCEQTVREFLLDEIDEHCSNGVCDFGR